MRSSCFFFRRRSASPAVEQSAIDKTRQFLTEWHGLLEAEVNAHLAGLDDRDAKLLYLYYKNGLTGSHIRVLKLRPHYEQFMTTLFSPEGKCDNYVKCMLDFLITHMPTIKKAFAFFIDRSTMPLNEIKSNALNLAAEHHQQELVMACLLLMREQKDHYDLALYFITEKRNFNGMGLLYDIPEEVLPRLKELVFDDNLSLQEARDTVFPVKPRFK